MSEPIPLYRWVLIFVVLKDIPFKRSTEYLVNDGLFLLWGCYEWNYEKIPGTHLCGHIWLLRYIRGHGLNGSRDSSELIIWGVRRQFPPGQFPSHEPCLWGLAPSCSPHLLWSILPKHHPNGYKMILIVLLLYFSPGGEGVHFISSFNIKLHLII